MEPQLMWTEGNLKTELQKGVMWRSVLTVALLCCSSEGSVTCRDENDGEVDWYILYKTPRNQKKSLDGLEYVYIYPAGPQNVFRNNNNNIKINSPNGILANTLRPLFAFQKTSPPPNFGYISYNDGVPEGYSAAASLDSTDTSGGSASSSFGHSKGVVMVEKDGAGGTGVWLLHSTPQFPYNRDENEFWPKSGGRNAQIFICVTFNYDQFKHIGNHLQYIRAFPFDSHFPPTLNLNELHQVTTRKTRNHNTPNNNQFASTFQQLISRGGKKFYSIFKQVSSEAEDGDLYVSISEKVHSDVYVQSWGCQPERDGSFCLQNRGKVQNILFVDAGLGKWDPGSDHSKWCVAVDQNKPWTCIADVNRSESQYERLGGALCIIDEDITNIFKSFGKIVEGCEG